MCVNPHERNMVFVSHANPEENELALWLSLQLANEGYAVWCDLTKLLGGEKFWEDIQEAISTRTAKFVYILSRASNQKRGTLDELDCAIGTEKRHQLRDFIITVKADDLALRRRLHRCPPTQPYRLQAWAKGLSILLDKFEKDAVPKSPGFNRDAVCSWWRDQFSADAGIIEQPEQLRSNWFKVENVPTVLYEHKLAAIKPGPVGIEETAVRLSRRLGERCVLSELRARRRSLRHARCQSGNRRHKGISLRRRSLRSVRQGWP